MSTSESAEASQNHVGTAKGLPVSRARKKSVVVVNPPDGRRFTSTKGVVWGDTDTSQDELNMATTTTDAFVRWYWAEEQKLAVKRRQYLLYKKSI